MHRRIRICFVLLFSLTCGLANAQVGHLKDVIQEAKEQRTPGYISDLMGRYARALNEMAKQKNLDTPKKKLAWFLAARAIVKLAYATTNDAASGAAGDAIATAFYNGVDPNTENATLVSELTRETAKSAVNGLHNLDWLAATAAISQAGNEWDDVHDSEKIWRSATKAYYSAKREALNAARAVACPEVGSILVTARVAWRVAEWSILNYFFTDLESFVESLYNDALAGLSDDSPNNPFSTPDGTMAFYNQHFAQLSSEAMSFLKHWLGLYPIYDEQSFEIVVPDWLGILESIC